MISIVQANDVYTIKFKYDPDVINLVKNVPGRRWNSDEKYWTIPSDKLGFLLNQFKGTIYYGSLDIHSDEKIDQNEEIDVTTSIPDINLDTVNIQIVEGSKPYKHQIDFMKWSIERQLHGNMSGFVLGDDPGLGKTVEVFNLGLHNRKYYNFKHCLIICCINSSKYNWQSDILKHSNGSETPYILGTRLKRDGSLRYDTGGKEKLEDLESLMCYGSSKDPLPYFLITNIESIRYKVGRNYPIADRIIKLIKSGDINMIALDEIHKNTSPQSAQGKQILRIKQNSGKQAMWIPMSGTPITKQPTDVFLPLRLVDGHDFKSFYIWSQRYCMYGGYGGYDIVGYKNIPELKGCLQKNMLRRKRDDVLDLPPKVRCIEYVELNSYQRKLYESIRAEMLRDYENILKSINPQSMFLRLRQVTGNPELIDGDVSWKDKGYLTKNAKLQRLLELVKDICDKGEKVIIYSNWVESLRTLYRYVASVYVTACYTGTMDASVRESHKQKFQTDPNCLVMMGTIGAMGTSHTLTAANNVIFYDDPWNPSDKEQAEDRVYRIGTTQTVNVYTIVAKDTVDERIEEILYTKEAIANYIVDNKIDIHKNPDLFWKLLK